MPEKKTTGGLIKAGDDLLRQVLIEAAHRLIRYNPKWKAMSDLLRATGKKTCVIVAAVANRWIRKLFHQMCEPTPGDSAGVRFLRHGQESTQTLKDLPMPGEVFHAAPEVCFLDSVIP